jgi:hypothetical protein
MTVPTDRKMPLQTKMRFGFNLALILLFAYTTYEAWGFQRLARYLPLSISILALLVMLVGLLLDIVAYRRQGFVAGDDVPVTAALAGSEIKEHKLQAGKTGGDELADDATSGITVTAVDEAGEPVDPADVPIDTSRMGAIEPPRVILLRSAVVLAWILGYIVGIAVIGIVAASAIYLPAYLILQAKTGWKVPVIGTVAILAMMWAMREGLNLEWPDYMLEDTFASIFGWD